MPVQKEFKAMDHDTHQYKILGLGLALIVATVLVLLAMHNDGSSGDGLTLRLREEPVVVVDTAPALRALSTPVSSLTSSNRAPRQDRR